MKYKKFFVFLLIFLGSFIGAGYSMKAKGEFNIDSIKKFFQNDQKNSNTINKKDSQKNDNQLQNQENFSDNKESFLDSSIDSEKEKNENSNSKVGLNNSNQSSGGGILGGIFGGSGSSSIQTSSESKKDCENLRSVVKGDFSEMAERLMPSVVSVITTKKVENKNSALFLDRELKDFLEKFFPFGEIPGMKEDREKGNTNKEVTFGSGVVISKDGYIVTNNHVVEDSHEIIIKFHDDSQIKAEIVGSDELTDLALLKIIDNKKDLIYANFGDSEKSKIGSWVMAIGNPFGLGGSISIGVISAISRDINTGPYDNFIQTDAAINRGHSGGPLFNICGQIIGINTAIISPSGGNVGIGFAIPSKTVESIISKLKSGEAINRGYIGVKVQMVTQEIANSLKIGDPHGALIVDIIKDSPAYIAGLEVGDLIVEIDGKKIKNMRNLPKIISEIEIGKKIILKILRNGSIKEFDILIAKSPELYQSSKNSQQSKKNEIHEKEEFSKELGLTVRELSPDFLKKGGKSEDEQILGGVLISKIEPGSVMANSGLLQGDIILQINRDTVKNLAEFKNLLKNLDEKDSILMLVYRGGSKIFFGIQLK